MGFFKDNRHLECQENWEAGQWEVSRRNTTQIQCEGCGKTDAVPGRLSMEEIKHIRCAQCVDKEAREAARPREVKAQPKGEVKIERNVRRTVKMITEVWIKVGIEKLDNHEGVTVKALLDSGATCSEPTPEPELSQLLFYQRGQRELVRVPISLVCLVIHISNGLCTYYPALLTK